MPDERSCYNCEKSALCFVRKNFNEALNIAEEVDEAARVYLLTGGKAPPISSENIGHIKSLRNP